MKLFIIITLIACSYAEKLDRGYLPPESAATAGGSPGSLTAPGSGTGPGFSTSPSFGQTSGAPFGQPSGPTFGQGSAQIGPQTGSVQPGQSGVGQYTPQQYNQGGGLLDAGRLGAQQTGYNQGLTPGGSAQGPSSNLGGQIRGTAPTFGGQSQGPAVYSGQVQPERARASIDRNAEILRYDNQNDGETYAYSFETSNGISAEESGVATNGVQAQGAFAYTGDDGQQYRVIYTADENGYRPQGDHLPTPPPIPEEILKSLAKNAQAAASGTQEGAYNPDEDLGVAINPQQYSGNYYGQGQPSQAAIGYQTNQGIPSKYSDSGVSPAAAAGLGGQGLQNQGPTSQYTGPGSSARLPGAVSGIGSPSNAQYNAPGANAPGSIGYSRPLGGQTSGPQYGASSSPATSGTQGIPSQTGIPSQYNAPGVSPTSPTISSGPGLSGSVMPGAQAYKQDSGYEYNSPGSSGPGRFGSQGPQVTIGQRPSSQYNTPGLTSAGSSRPGSQDSSSQVNPSIDSQYSSPSELSGSSRPITGSGSGAPGITSINGGSPSRFAQQGSQNSGYNYNNPTNSALSGPSRSDSQNYPSQGSQSSPQYSGPTKSPFGTSSLNRPQGTPGYSGPGLGASNAARPSGSDDAQSQNNQYNAPFASTSDSARPKEQAQPGFNQRPQFGSSSPLGLGPQGTAGQGSNDGYQYNQPQTKFDGPSRNGAFPGPSGIDSQSSGPASTGQYNPASNGPSQGLGSLSPNQGLAPGNSGNTYSPSGSPTGLTTSPNGLGYPRPSGSASQGYPSGPAIAGATNVAPGTIGQGSNLPSTGQYTSGPTSSPSGSVFPRPGSLLAQNQPGQSAGTKSPLPGSAPYQYNRPGSQGPLSGSSQTPFGTQPGNVFGSSEQNKPDQTAFGPSGQVTPSQVSSQSNGPLRQDRPGSIGSPSSFGPSAQTGPGQAGSQPNMRPSGQDKPTENFGGPRQPPSFSSDEGYKY